jgi:hypothetical protein
MAIVSGFINLSLDLKNAKATTYSTSAELFKPIFYSITNGTTAGKIDLLYSATRTLTASASEDLDLSGELVDTLGQTCVFADVRMICVVASSANTNNVLVGGAASNQFINWVGNSSDIVVVKPGGILFLYTPTDPGYAVTAGTGDLLKIANSGAGTGVTFDIYIGGTSA